MSYYEVAHTSKVKELEEVIARSPQVSVAQRYLLLIANSACAADGEFHEQEKSSLLPQT